MRLGQALPAAALAAVLPLPRLPRMPLRLPGYAPAAPAVSREIRLPAPRGAPARPLALAREAPLAPAPPALRASRTLPGLGEPERRGRALEFLFDGRLSAAVE